ncbi:MAG: tRNA lysidine(34) synthetase TilS [Bacteroidales bacterium]|nr:tRNA lysidine(34) synthetase TilS [Bacteroidales bacterium]
MYQKFLDYIESNGLFSPDDRILLGVSGGVDSMVMAYLFLKAGFTFAIAHCNFGLRGEESENDQEFVQSFSSEHDLAFHTKKFDTETFASENKLSVQMAARRLRYRWFDQLRQRYNYDVIAMGHNKDDLVETFFINIARGTGLKGITGIKPRNHDIVRPLLFATREEIMKHSADNDIAFREDSSNRTVKYSRNKIRHHIIPEFQRLNPRFLETVRENTERFQDAYTIYLRAVEEKKAELTCEKGKELYIDIRKLHELKEKNTYLFEILKPYEFTKEVIHEIVEHLEDEPGKEFFSSTHKLIRDRDYLIVAPREKEGITRFYIDEWIHRIDKPIPLKFNLIEDVQNYRIPRDPHKVAIDYDKVQFPLMLRKWKHGDYFKPFGFEHYKKLKDFFVDRKYSILDKERVWILASGEKIVWIVGDRLDDRFRVDDNTRQILEITYFIRLAY